MSSAVQEHALTGKVALVTGGGGGLGAAICEALAEAGATVVAADVRREMAVATIDRLKEGSSDRHMALALDVTEESAVDECVTRVLREYDRLDIAINNAGTDVTLPIDELTVEQWDRVLDVNLRGPFLLSKRVFSLMKKLRRGHILNVVSTAAKRAWPNASAYHASKWGLLGLSHALHAEGRVSGIKVTAIIAGGMRTPFLLDRFPDIDPAVLQDPRNVAETIRFVLTMPEESVIPEITVLPMRETSWP